MESMQVEGAAWVEVHGYLGKVVGSVRTGM